MDNVAIVIVTYRRQKLLGELFDSILELTVAPWRVVVVDNENSSETEHMVRELSCRMAERWGETAPDATGSTDRANYAPQLENLGGSGGFSAGVLRAYELGAEWFWIMDDDVRVEPEGLERLSKWTDRFEVIQGQRYDYGGEPFYWQYHFWVSLGIYDPFAPASFGGEPYRHTKVACFEGGLFKRSVVEKIGAPDNRFFIYWDDAIYGYRASKVCDPVLVPDFVLRRSREVASWEIAGGKRQLNSASDMNRYYIMRNRGYMARYFALNGDYHRAAFGLGTILSFAKELVRILIVDRGHLASGTKQLFRGWRDSRKILRDKTWEPMPPLKP